MQLNRNLVYLLLIREFTNLIFYLFIVVYFIVLLFFNHYVSLTTRDKIKNMNKLLIELKNLQWLKL